LIFAFDSVNYCLQVIEAVGVPGVISVFECFYFCHT